MGWRLGTQLWLRRTLKPRRKQILLIAANELMAKWLGYTVSVLRDDPRLNFTITTQGPADEGLLDRCARIVDVKSLPYEQASLRPYDLAICADHILGEPFHPGIPTVNVGHCTTASKNVDGRLYPFSSNYNIRPSGIPRYACRFVPSERVRQQALDECSQLKNILAVVGDLQTDHMLAMVEHREQIRSDMGFESSDKVALILSSWGSDSIMEQMGKEIVAQASELHDRFKFIFSTHPNHWRGSHAANHPWGQYLADHQPTGSHIVQPDSDTLPALVASDMAITDHGSMATNYAILKKPLGVVAIESETLTNGSIGQAFQQTLPRIRPNDSLGDFLDQLADSCPIDEMYDIAHRFIPHAGEAADRTRKTIYDLLDIRS